MKKFLLYLTLSLFIGWVFQTLFLYFLPSGLPTPQWLLLATLAFGARGRTKSAMTLGFLWGLFLDAHGMSAFGSQGWLLAFIGYISGNFSKNLNADKFGTQLSIAMGASVILEIGIRLLAFFFDQTRVGHPGVGLALTHVLLNGLASPAVFWAVTAWGEFWDPRPLKDNA